MKKIAELRKNKIFKIIMTIIRAFIAVILIGFFIVVCLQRFSNNRMSIFNYRMFTVISGSMAPKYNIGDVLISKNVGASEVKVGDAISYLGKEGTFKDKVITHEVVGIEKDSSGKYLFRTKGLANIVEDPIVGQDQLYGVVIYRSGFLSLIYGIVNTRIGFYLFIIIPIMFIIASEIIKMLLDKEEKRREVKNNL